jgi:hypothetical protein
MPHNVAKTQHIVIGNAANINRMMQVRIEMNGTVIKSCDCIKSLRLQNDSTLSLVEHINSISQKCHFMAKSLYSLKPVLSELNIQKIIEACLNSLVNYLVVLWVTA